MTSDALLPWLLRPDTDFRGLCDEIDRSEAPRGNLLRQAAFHDLSSNHLHRLARSVVKAISDGASAPLDRMTLAVASNATTDLLTTALIGSGARYGLALSIETAPFGITLQAALDSSSSVLDSRPDVVLLALDHRAHFPETVGNDAAETNLRAAQERLAELVSAFKASSNAMLVVQTLAMPPERVFGSFEHRQPGTLAWLVARFNEWLLMTIAGPGVAVLDVASLAANIGCASWFDPAQWYLARLPFAQRYVPYYSEHVARLLAAIRGKSRKVLVLDLDNTIWGGVIGDDGLRGVKLGQGDPVGEAFLELQRAALSLKARGVLLALCSKNDEQVALSAIREHPDMLLKEEDFSAFQINWSDKASNLEVLAKRLSLGLDSFVFFDDNPFEREQVRAALPNVFVPELPADPAGYARLLLTSGVFEAMSFSQEDRDRADQYAANAQRKTLLTQSRDLDGYFRSLDMRVVFTADGSIGWERFAQLINKSNQFNLTTRRYSEAEVLALADDPSTLTLQVRLLDRFGDNGLISCVICRCERRDWLIDAWVMSCRVLGRQVEEAVLNEIVRRATAAGIETIRGTYRATDRNGMVKDHYPKLGFVETGSGPESTSWMLAIDRYVPRETAIVRMGA
jgi:FkbH-like protein